MVAHDKSLIWVSLDIKRVEEECIMAEFTKRGLKVGVTGSRELKAMPHYDFKGSIVLIRNMSAVNSIYVAAIADASGGVPVNSTSTLVIGHDKILTYAALAKRGLKIPRSFIALEDFREYEDLEKLKFPVIVKPPIGSWGRLVSVAKNSNTLKSIISHGSLLETPHLKVRLIQEPGMLGVDVRCFVVGGSLIACMERRGPPGEWRSNAALGGAARPYKPDCDVEEASIKAAESLNAEIAGVDLIFDGKGEFYVNEVNVVPEFKALMKATGVNVAGAIVDYVLWKARR
ncbi:MAG: RimK family alpha-L-glutamate ligase [Thermoprotei archaeon]|nr:RimK family alpha-L-glutamate ligase [Thermoprotei archaeon]